MDEYTARRQADADAKREKIMRLQANGMRAMSREELARRQLEAASCARQRGPLNSGEQEAARNFWGATADAQNNIIPDTPQPSLWSRFKHWIKA
jgi:hypothetical protein